jgi:hypothetical protein
MPPLADRFLRGTVFFVLFLMVLLGGAGAVGLIVEERSRDLLIAGAFLVGTIWALVAATFLESAGLRHLRAGRAGPARLRLVCHRVYVFALVNVSAFLLHTVLPIDQMQRGNASLGMWAPMVVVAFTSIPVLLVAFLRNDHSLVVPVGLCVAANILALLAHGNTPLAWVGGVRLVYGLALFASVWLALRMLPTPRRAG